MEEAEGKAAMERKTRKTSTNVKLEAGTDQFMISAVICILQGFSGTSFTKSFTKELLSQPNVL